MNATGGGGGSPPPSPLRGDAPTLSTTATTTHFTLVVDDSPSPQRQQQHRHHLSPGLLGHVKQHKHKQARILGWDDTIRTLDSDEEDEADYSEPVHVVSAAPTPHSCWQHWSRTTGRLVRSQWYKRTVLGLILLNAICMAVRTCDWVQQQDDNNNNLVDWSNVLDTAIRVFRVLFTVEFGLALSHYQRVALRRGWLWLDAVVLVLSWWVAPSMMILRCFRLIRALRKATTFQVAQLNLLVQALLFVVPQLLAVLLLVGLVLFLFAVIMTDLYQDVYDDFPDALSENYFGRLDQSAWTLFQIMTLDGWSTIANQLMTVYPWSAVLIVVFVILTSFGLGALMIAVMGQALTTVAQQRLHKALQNQQQQQQQQDTITPLDAVVVDPNTATGHGVTGDDLDPTLSSSHADDPHTLVVLPPTKTVLPSPTSQHQQQQQLDRLEASMQRLTQTVQQLVLAQQALQQQTLQQQTLQQEQS